MVAAVETAWLFTRGSESVRIVRAAGRGGAMHLMVHGPNTATDAREFPDVVSCMNYQADFERRLVADGFVLERFTSDRRGEDGCRRPGAPERRRRSTLFA